MLPTDLLRQILSIPSLEITLKKEWGSAHATYRADIRQALSAQLKEDFSDLARTPFSKTTAISVSHCPHLGGFATASKPGALGFDIEVEARVEKRIAARMSTPEEMVQAPSPAHLWVAKESAYKSLYRNSQPATLSAIEIRDWTQKFSVWNFRAFCPTSSHFEGGQGVVFTQAPLIFSLFACSSST